MEDVLGGLYIMTEYPPPYDTIHTTLFYYFMSIKYCEEIPTQPIEEIPTQPIEEIPRQKKEITPTPPIRERRNRKKITPPTIEEIPLTPSTPPKKRLAIFNF